MPTTRAVDTLSVDWAHDAEDLQFSALLYQLLRVCRPQGGDRAGVPCPFAFGQLSLQAQNVDAVIDRPYESAASAYLGASPL